MRRFSVAVLWTAACGNQAGVYSPNTTNHSQTTLQSGGPCTLEKDCVNGESCNTDIGKCQPTCLKDADCSIANMCGPDNFCVPRSRGSSSGGSSGGNGSCTLLTASTACQNNQYCNTFDSTTGVGSCTLAPTCRVQVDCPTSLFCQSGYCKTPAPCSGGTCDAGFACSSGFCLPPATGTTGGTSGGTTGGTTTGGSTGTSTGGSSGSTTGVSTGSSTGGASTGSSTGSSTGASTGGSSGTTTGGVAPTYGACTFDDDCDNFCANAADSNASRMNGGPYGDLHYKSDRVCDITADQQIFDANNAFTSESGLCRDRCSIISYNNQPVVAVACPFTTETCFEHSNTDNPSYPDYYCGISSIGDFSACE